MAKYKDYSYDQGVFLPVFFDKQILPGTFEYSLNHLIDSEVDLSIFDKRYNNDETGAPAYDPRIFLKIVLFAYSRGITSSRKITWTCLPKRVLTLMWLTAFLGNEIPGLITPADIKKNTKKDQVILKTRFLL